MIDTTTASALLPCFCAGRAITSSHPLLNSSHERHHDTIRARNANPLRRGAGMTNKQNSQGFQTAGHLRKPSGTRHSTHHSPDKHPWLVQVRGVREANCPKDLHGIRSHCVSRRSGTSRPAQPARPSQDWCGIEREKRNERGEGTGSEQGRGQQRRGDSKSQLRMLGMTGRNEGRRTEVRNKWSRGEYHKPMRLTWDDMAGAGNRSKERYTTEYVPR
jgi:hypothetical protein